MDFIGSFAKGFERLQEEIKRAKENGAYIIILCEADMNDALSFHYKPFFKNKTKATGDFIFHNVREMMQTYDNVQVACCNGRISMSNIVKKIFSFKEDISQYDIQFLIDSKILV